MITQAQIEEYNENGYIVVKNLISPENLAKVRQKVDDIQNTILEAQAAARKRNSGVDFIVEPGSGGGTAVAAKPVLRKLAELAPNDEFFRSIASSQNILDVVSALTGGNRGVYLYSDQVFLKPAFCGSEKPLHQDNSYFKVTPNTAGVTCWMALDDATIENGCMHYIPGTHKLGRIPHKEIKNTPHLTPESDTPFGNEVPVPIPAGAAIFHNLLTLHSSKANTSPHSRRAWALHFANACATDSVKPFSQMLKLR
ncbi:MAG TPA: phytanoyl-CoA dioxygenase family protein [Planctomycetota bacterium]|nr:phytanoyl-CoA dioxygenase family protein [Planctomycetota bacterium]